MSDVNVRSKSTILILRAVSYFQHSFFAFSAHFRLAKIWFSCKLKCIFFSLSHFSSSFCRVCVCAIRKTFQVCLRWNSLTIWQQDKKNKANILPFICAEFNLRDGLTSVDWLSLAMIHVRTSYLARMHHMQSNWSDARQTNDLNQGSFVYLIRFLFLSASIFLFLSFYRCLLFDVCIIICAWFDLYASYKIKNYWLSEQNIATIG